MKNKEFIIELLLIVLQMDIRLQFCSFYKVGGVFIHSEKKCERCQVLYLLDLYQ